MRILKDETKTFYEPKFIANKKFFFNGEKQANFEENIYHA